jgi:type II secretory pathway pseudopilin PulG
MTTGAVLGRPNSGRFRLKSRAPATGGFTITEVMIFLAVSSGLFLIIATQINGQQSRSDFGQTVHDFETRLQDLANDVSTGFYNNNDTFSCTATPGTAPVLGPPVADNQGRNTGCILVGEVVDMPINSPNYSIYPLAGTQKTVAAGQIRDVGNLTEALPTKVTAATLTDSIGHDLIIKKVTYNLGVGELPGYGVAFVTTFGIQGAGGLGSSDINVNLLPLSSGVLGTSLSVWPAIFGSAGGARVTICIQDGTSPSRHAEVVLGGKGRQLTTQVDIFDNTAVCS